MKSDELLLSIARCPELATARTDRAHPCSKIAGVQPGGLYQVPEPWSGHIEKAPILFISSNPSINEDEYFPTPSWSQTDTIDYFRRRFDLDAGYVSPKAYNRVRFWTGIRARAKEILKRDAVPGQDFALTELVHCKSRREHGVREALPLCSKRWLEAIMEHSVSRIVILLGGLARDTCAQLWKLDRCEYVHFDISIAGCNRAVVILPHPNAYERKTIASRVPFAQLERLNSLLLQPRLEHKTQCEGF